MYRNICKYIANCGAPTGSSGLLVKCSRPRYTVNDPKYIRPARHSSFETHSNLNSRLLIPLGKPHHPRLKIRVKKGGLAASIYLDGTERQ